MITAQRQQMLKITTNSRVSSLLSGRPQPAEQNSGISPYFLILIFNLSLFELVGFQTKLFKDLWYMDFHAVKVFSMFFLSSLVFSGPYCVRLHHENIKNVFERKEQVVFQR